MTDEHAPTRRRMPPRTHSSFATRTATDDAERLNRRGSILPAPSPGEETPLLARDGGPPSALGHDGQSEALHARDYALGSMRDWFSRPLHLLASISRKDGSNVLEGKHHSGTDASKPRPGAFPRPVGGTSKLGTFAGVFVPTTLNVLSILMFLRFGFILGQAGVVGMLGPSCFSTGFSPLLTQNRHARRLLCHQSFNNNVYLGYRYQWHRPWRRCLLSYLSIART